ncbi:MAG TPA: hypothetical protein VFT69_15150 [Pseudolabrys sp.]|jgi:hypothetical protein|nr:hypothetical protein [Pseudolabrys sp.]
MIKVTNYRKHAEECRRLANQASLPHIRDGFLKMAETWNQLAEQRELGLTKDDVKAPVERDSRR